MSPVGISIHALRGEGDAIRACRFFVAAVFQSTPSVGRATKAGTPATNDAPFQSTPSVGRATWLILFFPPLRRISIHALRGEGDISRTSALSLFAAFQSTPSVGRATFCVVARAQHRKTHFNPRPPWGGRQNSQRGGQTGDYFNPRPPWGGRPFAFFVIDIRCVRFQSTPSVGRATTSGDTKTTLTAAFQSTPSVGRATLCALFYLCSRSNFNPRPPWGGRPSMAGLCSTRSSFQSTPSVGRATFSKVCGTVFKTFQSTPSVGRATKNAVRVCGKAADFNPRPPWGGRRKNISAPDTARGISIHALRGEGDWQCKPRIIRLRHFNPRPPWGGRPEASM